MGRPQTGAQGGQKRWRMEGEGPKDGRRIFSAPDRHRAFQSERLCVLSTASFLPRAHTTSWPTVSHFAMHLLYPTKGEQRWHGHLSAPVTNIPMMPSREKLTQDGRPRWPVRAMETRDSRGPTAQPRPCRPLRKPLGAGRPPQQWAGVMAEAGMTRAHTDDRQGYCAQEQRRTISERDGGCRQSEGDTHCRGCV